MVEAIGVLCWPRDSVYVLSVGCSEEAIAIPSDAGFLGLALKMADIFFLGQSRGALGTAKLLTGHSESNPKLFRYQHIAGSGEFNLDATDRITALKGIGASMAREAMPQITQVFLRSSCEKFVPFHS